MVLHAGASGAGAAPAEPPPESSHPYTAPPPVRIYRFHVYSTMKARWKKTVMVDALVSTSQGGVTAGDKALLERKLDAAAADGSDWAPVAKVVVKRLLPKGRLEMEIQSEEAEAKVKRHGKLPFAPGQSVRLQIDRVM